MWESDIDTFPRQSPSHTFVSYRSVRIFDLIKRDLLATAFNQAKALESTGDPHLKRLGIALLLVSLLVIPAFSSSSAGWEIVRADYGWGNNWIDVTDRVRSLVQNDSLNFRVDGNALGATQRRGRNRTLRLQLKDNVGSMQQMTFRESEQVSLQVYDRYKQALRITLATYGADNRTADVTQRLNSQIRGDQLTLQVSNETMGGDPARNRAKRLTVQYSMNGQSNQAVVREGEYLRLPERNGYSNNNDRNDDYRDGNRQLAQRVVCESLRTYGDRRNYCAANTSGGVRLSRTIGDSQCNEGSSWGYDNGGIWVDRGCRGEFEMGGNRRRSRISGSTTLTNGTALSVRTNEVIDSRNATEGQAFTGTIATDVLDNTGSVVIPAGSDVELVIRSANGGSLSSASELMLDLNSVTVDGSKYFISTDDLERQGGQGVGANKQTAIMVGGGAALGSIIGAVVGGGKGAAIGAAIGGGAGLGTEVLTKGKQVRVPSETILNFKLDQDLRLQARR
jgi:hypothetical protein